MESHTPQQVKAKCSSRITILAADLSEIEIQSSALLSFQKETWSEKSHCNTIKWGNIICLDGTIAMRLPCYGGGTGEADALLKFYNSKLVSQSKTPIAFFADRGLRDLEVVIITFGIISYCFSRCTTKIKISKSYYLQC